MVIVFCQAALLSTENLTVLLKDVEFFPLGEHLGFKKNRLQAIFSYYGHHSELATSHMIELWLRSHPKDPIKKLTVALKSKANDEVAKVITFLSAPIKYGKK